MKRGSIASMLLSVGFYILFTTMDEPLSNFEVLMEWFAKFPLKWDTNALSNIDRLFSIPGGGPFNLMNVNLSMVPVWDISSLASPGWCFSEHIYVIVDPQLSTTASLTGKLTQNDRSLYNDGQWNFSSWTNFLSNLIMLE